MIKLWAIFWISFFGLILYSKEDTSSRSVTLLLFGSMHDNFYLFVFYKLYSSKLLSLFLLSYFTLCKLYFYFIIFVGSVWGPVIILLFLYTWISLFIYELRFIRLGYEFLKKFIWSLGIYSILLIYLIPLAAKELLYEIFLFYSLCTSTSLKYI